MLLSIIIVSYNTQELTVQTLESVAREVNQSSLLRKQTEVYVIDNNSSDDSVEAIKKLKKDLELNITIIQNDKNVGFGVANNLGIEKSTGKYVLLLNSDTIVQPAALERMVQAFEDNPVQEATAMLNSQTGRLDRLGILSPLLLQPDGKPQLQGGALPNLFNLKMHWLLYDDLPIIGRFLPSTQQKYIPSPEKSGLIQYGWIPGTAMMIRRQVIDEVGPLDQNIFMYGEDMELCIRAKKHHWDVALLPTAQITHVGSASSSSTNAIMGEMKGYLYIWAKHKPVWQKPLLKLLLWLGCMVRIFLFGILLRQKKRASIYAQAVQDVLR